jgi:hypothetical protein
MQLISGQARYIYVVFVTLIVSIYSCNSKPQQVVSQQNTGEKQAFTFAPYFGIKYTEVKRVFDNGLTFSDKGYQLEPSWKISFLSDDSVNIYSPTKKMYVNLPVTIDHDSVFNMAWAWLRLQEMNKDSIKLEVLKVLNQEVRNEGPTVYMTLYADDYIKNVLKTDASELSKPSRRDTLFVKERAELFNSNFDSIFAARNIVTLKSKSPLLHIKKLPPRGLSRDDIVIEDEYLTPEYNITIYKAYQDFNYSFSVIVDKYGQMHFGSSLVDLSPEFRESRIRIMKGIIDGYLKLYLDIKPGSTLGIPHASKFIVNVEGIKS